MSVVLILPSGCCPETYICWVLLSVMTSQMLIGKLLVSGQQPLGKIQAWVVRSKHILGSVQRLGSTTRNSERLTEKHQASWLKLSFSSDTFKKKKKILAVTRRLISCKKEWWSKSPSSTSEFNHWWNTLAHLQQPTTPHCVC